MQRIFQQKTGLSVFYIVPVLGELQVRPPLFLIVGFAEHRNVKSMNSGNLLNNNSLSWSEIKKKNSMDYQRVNVIKKWPLPNSRRLFAVKCWNFGGD